MIYVGDNGKITDVVTFFHDSYLPLPQSVHGREVKSYSTRRLVADRSSRGKKTFDRINRERRRISPY
jgi:hypothetical protein